jgi:transposase-like protein
VTSPRVHNGILELVQMAKNKTPLSHFDEKILTLYAKRINTCDIVETFREFRARKVPELDFQCHSSGAEQGDRITLAFR